MDRVFHASQETRPSISELPVSGSYVAVISGSIIYRNCHRESSALHAKVGWDLSLGILKLGQLRGTWVA